MSFQGSAEYIGHSTFLNPFLHALNSVSNIWFVLSIFRLKFCYNYRQRCLKLFRIALMTREAFDVDRRMFRDISARVT